MAVTATTPTRILLGAGEITIGVTSVGATMENTVFRVDKTEYFPKFNGVLGDVDQTGFITRLVPILEATMAEVHGWLLALGLPGITLTSDVSSEVLSDYVPGCKPAGQDITWTGQDCDGHDVTINIYNAIVTSNLELEFSDDNIVAYRYTFQGLYDPATPTVAPFTMVVDIA